MLERFARGWALSKASLRVLRLDTEILLLPALSGVVLLLLAAGALLPAVAAVLAGADPWVLLLAMLLLYFAGYFVVIYFNTGVVAMATIRFQGGDPVVKDGLRTAWQHKGRILQWALVAATVGLVLRMLRGEMRERYGFLADLLVGGLEVAWNAVVYFVVPVLVYRGLGPMDAIKESSVLIRRAWGETLAGEVGMGLVFFALGGAGLLALVGLTMAGAGGAFLLAALVAVVLYWIVLAVVYTAAQGVLTAALYQYATTGRVPEGFEHGQLQGALA